LSLLSTFHTRTVASSEQEANCRSARPAPNR
jgi:hypothetical protein